jgi:hypothetical protein
MKKEPKHEDLLHVFNLLTEIGFIKNVYEEITLKNIIYKYREKKNRFT